MHFSLVIVQLVKKLGSTINFFFVGFFVPILREHVVLSFFFKKNARALQYKFARANYIADFGNEKNIPRSSRVIRRHQIGRPNAMASAAGDEALIFYRWSVLKNALFRGVLKKNCKLT